MNTFGHLFKLTSFGESHGRAIGGVIDGCPAGIALDIDAVQAEMGRRRPGQSRLTTARNEADSVRFLSGIYKGHTTGSPIGFVIENNNTRSDDYSEIEKIYRPSHADYTYDIKYRGFSDPRGGGRSSARETAVRVVGGAVAHQVLATLLPDLKIHAFSRAIGSVELSTKLCDIDFGLIETNPVRCPDPATADNMEKAILEAKADGDTLGGIVECVVSGCPVGIGEPVYDKLSARLASAMLSINAAKGFEIGNGFAGTRLRGSESLDTWINAPDDSRGLRATANNSGGIQGGISNGEDIVFRVAFKPVATLLRDVHSVTHNHENAVLKARGRHDPCVVPRAVPVVEAMASMVILDLYLIYRARAL